MAAPLVPNQRRLQSLIDMSQHDFHTAIIFATAQNYIGYDDRHIVFSNLDGAHTLTKGCLKVRVCLASV
jgi:hypothetical protein